MKAGRSSFISAQIEGVECFRTEHSRHEYPRHSHEFYSIGVIEHGIGGSYYRGAYHEMPAGSIVVINPDEVHTGYAAGGRPLSYRMLHIDPEVFQRVTPGSKTLLRFTSTAIHDPHQARSLARLHAKLELGTDPLDEEEHLIEALADLVDVDGGRAEFPRSGGEPRSVRMIKEYLESHYGEKVRLSDLVRLTNLDRAYLIRRFRWTAGMPPHEYLTQVRVRRAARELARGESIAVVAASAGFSDQSHLTRHFKRITGITPAQYATGHFRSRR